MSLAERVAERYLEAAGFRTLFHIGRRPPEPKPKATYFDRGQATDEWERPWLEESVREGIFLTPNPIAVAENHFVNGHVYAYSVPEWVIKEAKGLHRYDSATEILIPAHLWRHIKFKGKSMDRREFDKFLQHLQSQARLEKLDFYTAYQSWKREKGRAKAQKERDEIMRTVYVPRLVG